jgi:coenzyme F420-0:L-glutamate ligase/coenzyme F420-1:gamma-L-glutamate ligase
MEPIQILPISSLPEVRPGDNVALRLLRHFTFAAADVLVIAQKIVSKSEGRLVALSSVMPSPEAVRLAADAQKDPRLVQLILDESRRVVRIRPGLIIVEDRRGWICANAGIDRSNVSQDGRDETVCLLPIDPDASAARIRATIREESGVDIGVIINDSHGRAWRDGTVGVAIGAAGIAVKADRRGMPDRHGYILQHSVIGTADELAAAASVVMGQAAESIPAAVIRGLNVGGDGRATELQRAPEQDLFR